MRPYFLFCMVFFVWLLDNNVMRFQISENSAFGLFSDKFHILNLINDI